MISCIRLSFESVFFMIIVILLIKHSPKLRLLVTYFIFHIFVHWKYWSCMLFSFMYEAALSFHVAQAGLESGVSNDV